TGCRGSSQSNRAQFAASGLPFGSARPQSPDLAFHAERAAGLGDPFRSGGGVRRPEANRSPHRTRVGIEKNDEKDQPRAGRVVYHGVILRARWNARPDRVSASSRTWRNQLPGVREAGGGKRAVGLRVVPSRSAP